MSSNASEARISNHKYTCWEKQALHVDTNVQRKRPKDHDISNHKYTCWDEQALHVDTNVAIAYCVGTLTLLPFQKAKSISTGSAQT
jgi:hypothetical protein